MSVPVWLAVLSDQLQIEALVSPHPDATLLTPEGAFAFDLHVLGTPPALILSQDQTLS